MASSARKKNKSRLWKIVAIIGVLVIGFMIMRARSSGGSKEIIRTAKVERGMVVASVSANGVLQPVTTVEVKSNVGGQVVQLAVDEGDVVRAGQLIAKIDPSDSISNLAQSQADMESAQAKVQQTEHGLTMQRLQTVASIASATQALEASRQRLAQAEQQAKIQPMLTREAIKQAQSSLESAQATLVQTKNALVPQKLAAAKASYEQAKATFDQASNDLTRKKALLEKGFVSKSQLDVSQQQYSVASAQLDTAKNKLETVKDESDQDLKAAEARAAQAASALETANTNSVQNELKKQDLAAARAAVKQAEAALASAKASAYQDQMKMEDITQAKASLQRSQATLKNAQVQVGYTTIVAPRSGVVVKKYVENGSIVSAGRSSFTGSGSGVGLVDIADITHMMVQVNVDETDIAQIRIGQRVDVSVDAFPGERFFGKVTKIAPQAVADQNVTTVPVTVEIAQPGNQLKPAMNATCEFINQRKRDVLFVPSDAIEETDNGSIVKVMVGDKQVKRPVKTGLIGNDNTEILSGLKEGETVITAIIDPTDVTGSGRGFGGPGGPDGPRSGNQGNQRSGNQRSGSGGSRGGGGMRGGAMGGMPRGH